MTEDGNGVARIAPWGNGLYGAIAVIRKMAADSVSTDAAGQSRCGLPILTGLAPSVPVNRSLTALVKLKEAKAGLT